MEDIDALDNIHLNTLWRDIFRLSMKTAVEMRSLRERAGTLADSEEMPILFREKYSDIFHRLSPALTELDLLVSSMQPEPGCDVLIMPGNQDHQQSDENSDHMEQITSLNAIEDRLVHAVSTAGGNISSITDDLGLEWQHSAHVTVKARFQSFAERRCYDQMPPLMVEDCLDIGFNFADPDPGSERREWPHYLLDHRIFPQSLLPHLRGLTFDLSIEAFGRENEI